MSFSEVIKHSAYQQGIEQGKYDSFITSVKAFIKLGYTAKQACEMLEIDEDLKETILKEFDK